MLKALVLPHNHNTTDIEDTEQKDKQHCGRNHHKAPIALNPKRENRYRYSHHRCRNQQEQSEGNHGLWTQCQQAYPDLTKGLRKRLKLLWGELIRLQGHQEYAKE